MTTSSLFRPIRSLLAGAAILLATTVFAAEVGKPAPDFTLTDLDGKSVTLSSLKGKTVVLEWVNQECPFVIRHYNKTGNIPALQKSAAADGVVWLLINSAAPGKQGDYDTAKVKAWMEKTGAAPSHYFRDSDGKVGTLYDAKTTPHMYVINPDGVLVYNGAIDNSPRGGGVVENHVTAALAAVKAGEMPKTSVTVPYGCSVKY